MCSYNTYIYINTLFKFFNEKSTTKAEISNDIYLSYVKGCEFSKEKQGFRSDIYTYNWIENTIFNSVTAHPIDRESIRRGACHSYQYIHCKAFLANRQLSFIYLNTVYNQFTTNWHAWSKNLGGGVM